MRKVTGWIAECIGTKDGARPCQWKSEEFQEDVSETQATIALLNMNWQWQEDITSWVCEKCHTGQRY